ncbi:serine/threonine-protein kinase haspin-like isoform X1 [Rhipicephalus microplus]|uniref:serine/threonine-protein kinase haspin-like isoform X1 n=1 Tax=Rhipicephalus microplus TaxID=6941 RepID=UPI003F6A63EF
MAFHAIRGGSGARSSMHGVSYALLDRRPLLGKRRDEDSDDEEETAIDGKNALQQHERRTGSVNGESFEISTLSEIGVGDGATSWSEPDAPSESIWNDQDTVNRPADVFPSRLLDLCNQDTPLTFLTFLPKGCQDRSKWLAHGHHSEVFQVASPLKRTVLKVIPVTGVFTDQRVDAIAAAIECSVKLSLLRHGVRYRTPSFVETQRIACVFDLFPKWLLSGDRGLGSRDVQAGTNQCFLTRHFIVLELGYAGKPLSRITLRSAVQGRSVVLQASCCMAVAERALGFRHLSANPDKLLVTATDAASLEYHLPDRYPLTIDSAGLRVHVAGCLSFALGPEAKEEGSNSPSSPSRAKSALGNAPSQRSRSSEALRFKGNVTWLGAVVGSVMRKLRSELPESRARAERGLVEELSMLQRRLQQCDSVGEFFDTLSI